MTKWEYMYVVLPHDRTSDDKVAGEKVQHVAQIETILNSWGSQGWEVVAFTMAAHSGMGGVGVPRVCLKRALASA
jgi:hypothetical protein